MSSRSSEARSTEPWACLAPRALTRSPRTTCSRHIQEASVPDFPIIDSHVHLYDVERLRYAWLQRVPRINRTHVLKDFDEARGPVKVDGIVFAEVAVDP